MLVVGIDEAGRGPVIGPMIIAGVLIDDRDSRRLAEIGVADSKKLSPKRRDKLFAEITGMVRCFHIERLEPAVIDGLRPKSNLNRLEVEVMARILRYLRPNLAQVGSVDVIPSRFRDALLREVALPMEIVSVHHAEDRFPAVAAASIVAKVAREAAIAALREEYGDFGSGYPSDPKTREFISRWFESERSLPPIVRKSWKTAKIIAGADCASLVDF